MFMRLIILKRESLTKVLREPYPGKALIECSVVTVLLHYCRHDRSLSFGFLLSLLHIPAWNHPWPKLREEIVEKGGFL